MEDANQPQSIPQPHAPVMPPITSSASASPMEFSPPTSISSSIVEMAQSVHNGDGEGSIQAANTHHIAQPDTAINNSERQFMCPQCFKPFKSKQQLTQHSLVHTGLRKYTCTYCEKAFKQLCHLQQHTRIHTGKHTLI